MPSIGENAIGTQVRSLQLLLNYWARPQQPLVVDGVFGSKTKARVVQFQQVSRLDADGVVGPLTARALISAVSTMLFLPSNLIMM